MNAASTEGRLATIGTLFFCAYCDLERVKREIDELEALADEAEHEMRIDGIETFLEKMVHAIDCDMDEDCRCPAGQEERN